MSATTLSAKFQISIPKDVREEMGLKPGQKFEFLRIGRTLKLVPQPRMEDLIGLGRGANPDGYRDRNDRDARLSKPASAKKKSKAA